MVYGKKRMTKRKRTLRERANLAGQAYAKTMQPKIMRGTWDESFGIRSVGYKNGYLAGYRAGKREGMAKALKDCGWGK